MNYELKTALERVASRIRSLNLWSSLAYCWLAWGLAALMLLSTGPHPAGLVAILAGLAVASGLGCALTARLARREPRDVAALVEAARPDLNASLLTAVEEDLNPETTPRGYLRQTVIDRVVEHGREQDWPRAVTSRRKLAAARYGLVFASLGAIAAFGLLAWQSQDYVESPDSRLRAGVAALAAADLEVAPGDAEIERGTPLLVVARFGGVVPPEATLVIEADADEEGSADATRGMSRSLEDPTFASRIDAVHADLTYHVAFGDGRSPSYRVRVFEHPELSRIDANLNFPDYTAQPSKTIEDVRHVSAVEGTKAAFTFRVTKAVASAALVDETGAETPLQASADVPTTLRATMTLADSHRYKIRLIDHDGRSNKLSADLAVNVSPNRPPKLVLTAPGRDGRVSPVEELTIQAKAEDDYGVLRHGVTYIHADADAREIILSETDAKPLKTVSFNGLIDFESLRAEPDELVTYFVWAEDYGPDGAVRRSDGDMFFAEVRHFEEIFRQGEQSSSASQEQEQEGGDQAQQADQLVEQQKQVVNATWKVVRRENRSTPTADFVDDGALLRESQQAVVDLAEALGGQLQNPESRADLDVAVTAMKLAVNALDAAVAAIDPPGLSSALAFERSAYQALLKLRAREFQVSRSNSRSQSGSSGGSPSQRQLDQLALRDDEDRFEQQSRARSDESSERDREQRETRQVANRLRELAQRQSDLNERLKELQSALEAAKDDEARAEIERQLKRLRDQQQEILRDADELQERMEQERNRDRMADARQQVEESREHVRRASEALEEGRLSQALTEGARAGERLDQVREDMRRQSSNQFSEEMTEMREQARTLDEAQDRLTEELQAWNDRSERSLRDSDDRKDLEAELARQREDLETLVDRMKGTIQEAEDDEPLLARNLFDTVRKTEEQDLPTALRAAERLAQLGAPEEAARASQHAGQGLDQLREGVERAARGILGDEITALRRARNEVDDLADQLDREIAMATGRPRSEEAGNEREEAGDPQGQQGQGRSSNDRQEAPSGEPDDQAPNAQGRSPGEGGEQGQDREGRGQEPDQGSRQGRQSDEDQQQEPGQRSQGQPGEGQPGEGQPGEGQPGEGQEPGSPGQGGRGGEPRGGSRNRSAGDQLLDGLAQGDTQPGGPIRGGGFREWSDRMREVEELLEDPDLRAEAARIRDRVRGAREEFTRHAKEPDWTRLQAMAADPIRELRDRIAEEVRRREDPDALVPIDRDPVPPRFAEGVRRYYERLGSGR